MIDRGPRHESRLAQSSRRRGAHGHDAGTTFPRRVEWWGLGWFGLSSLVAACIGMATSLFVFLWSAAG